MELIKIGTFIMKMRKEKNLTQSQLAERIHVSNKTISKWETGKCLPDYGTIQLLCDELDITIAELMNGEMCIDNRIHDYDEHLVLNMLKRVQNLEQQKNLILGMMLICMGIAFYIASSFIDGSRARDFISGLMLGLSSGETLIGVYIMMRAIGKNI